MKRFSILLLLPLLCSLSLSIPGVYSVLDNADEFISPITTFHEVWGIPWGSSYDDFCEKARERYGISFIPFEERDDLPNNWFDLDLNLEIYREAFPPKQYYPTTLYASTYSPIYLFGYPIKITVFSGSSRERWELAAIKIDFVGTTTTHSTELALVMTQRIFNALSTQYGTPSFAYIYPPRTSSNCEGFTLPLNDNKLDITEVVEKVGWYMPIFAHFENVVFSSMPMHEIPPRLDTRYSLSILIVSPEWKNDPYVLPPKEILSWDDFDAIMESRPTPRPTRDNTPRIDIGL